MNLKSFYDFLLPQTTLNRALRILITVNATMVFVFGMFTPFYAVFVVRLGQDVAFAGLTWAVFSVVAGILTFLFSRWELKVVEQELLIVVGYFLRAAVFVSYAFMENVPQLVLTQILWGFAVAIGNPAFDAVYSSHTSRESSIVEWGNWEAIAQIATGLAALIGGVIIQYLGYQVMFLFMAALTIFLGVAILRLPRDVL